MSRLEKEIVMTDPWVELQGFLADVESLNLNVEDKWAWERALDALTAIRVQADRQEAALRSLIGEVK